MQSSTFRQKLRLVLLSGAGLITVPWGGIAQAQNQVAANTEVVTVTGTRIPRAEVDSPSPLVDISAQDIKNSGTTNLGDYLKRVPALVGSMGDFETNGFASPA